MMQILAARATASVLVFALLWAATGFLPARAERAGDLFAVTVPANSLNTGSAEAQTAAFQEGLKRVLVRLTGSDTAGEEVLLRVRPADPAALVQQFRRDDSGGLWVRFDGAAVRRLVEAAGMPVWGENRPLTVVWLTYDGGGQQTLLVAGNSEGPAAELRTGLLAAAADHAVPIVLPLGDLQDIAAAKATETPGDAGGALSGISQRYRAEAILLGRVQQFSPEAQQVSWTLVLGEERLQWQGSLADGPHGLAERLAERLAVAAVAAGGGTLRLAVGGIGSLDQYGLVLGHLRGLDAVASAGVIAADGDVLVFEVQLRGTRAQLEQALSLHGQIEPQSGAVEPAAVPGDSAALLSYRLKAAR